MATDQRESEAGMAMITAIMVCTVVMFLGMTSVALGDHSFSALRVDRKRVATFHGAEAGIDHALQVLQTTAQSGLPCGAPLTATLGTGPGSADYSVTFTYFDAAGVQLSCPLMSVPRSVLLESVGNSSDPLGSSRLVVVTANLSVPVSTTAFDKVVFAEGDLNLNTNLIILGNAGNDAVVYTNGDYSCVNSPLLEGFIYAKGDVSLGNFCAVNVDVWAGGTATMNGRASVGRDLVSGTSTITMNNFATVKRNARAGTTITTNGSSTIDGLRIPTSPTGPPPTSTFPQVPYVQDKWISAGYTIRPYTNCATAKTDLETLASTWTDPTVVLITGCRLDVTASSQIMLADHLAIVSDQGMTFGQSTLIGSVGNLDRELHLIVPYASLGSCSSTIGNIRMNQQFDVRPSVRTLAYTPCTLEVQNSGVLQGQFYGGTLDFKNNPQLVYRPVSGVPGYSPIITTKLVRHVAVLYKREV